MKKAQSMSMPVRLSALALSLILTACQSQAPATVPVGAAGDVPGALAPAANPVPEPPAIPAPSALVLPGTAEGPNGVFASAAVSAFIVGGAAQPVATATTAADGTFSLTLPETAAGKMLRLVVTKDGQTLVAATSLASEEVAPAKRQLLATQPVVAVNLASTLVAIALMPRLIALSKTNPNALTVTAVVNAVRAAATEAVANLKSLPPSLVSSLLAAAGPTGEGTVPATVALAATTTATFKNAMKTAADQVASAIRDAVSHGATLPPGTDAGTLVFGNVTSGGVATSGGSGGSGGGTATSDQVTNANLTVINGGLDFASTPGATVSQPSGIVDRIGGLSPSRYGTIVGDGQGGFWLPITDYADGRKSKFAHVDAKGGVTKTLAPSSQTGDTVPDGDGGLWAIDSLNNQVLHLHADGTAAQAPTGLPDGKYYPYLTLGADNSAWATSEANVTVHVVNGVAQAPIATVTADALQGHADGMFIEDTAPDGQGGLWACGGFSYYDDNENNYTVALVSHVSAAGVVTSKAYAASLGTASRGPGFFRKIVSDGQGGAWVSSPDYTGQVHHLDATATITTTYTTASGYSDYVELIADGAGGVWYTDTEDGHVYHVTATGTGIGADIRTGRDTYTTSDGTGGIWITTADEVRHYGYTAEGTPAVTRLNPDLSTYIDSPAAGLVYDAASGMLWAGGSSPASGNTVFFHIKQ